MATIHAQALICNGDSISQLLKRPFSARQVYVTNDIYGVNMMLY